VLAEFFHLEEDGYHQGRADREIAIYHSKAEAARANGTKGGRPANRTKTNPVSVLVRSEKLTTPHSPVREAPTGLPVTDEPSRPVAAHGGLGGPAHDTASVLTNLGNRKRVIQ
jgi:hypothetical protein